MASKINQSSLSNNTKSSATNEASIIGTYQDPFVSTCRFVVSYGKDQQLLATRADDVNDVREVFYNAREQRIQCGMWPVGQLCLPLSWRVVTSPVASTTNETSLQLHGLSQETYLPSKGYGWIIAVKAYPPSNAYNRAGANDLSTEELEEMSARPAEEEEEEEAAPPLVGNFYDTS